MMMSSSQIHVSTVNDRHPRSGVPANAKAILCLVLIMAALSTGRLNPTMRDYFERQLNTAGRQRHSTAAGRTLRSRFFGAYRNDKHQPRLVFYEGKPWTQGDDKDGLFSSNFNRTPPSMYPIQLRRRRSTGAANTTTDEEDEIVDDDDDDVTRYYPVGDSRDDFPEMERRLWPQHEFDPHCKPSAKWQSTFYPVCNEIHAVADLRQGLVDDDLSLLSSKGFWRHAWRHQLGGVNASSTDPLATTVWKTFKYVHLGPAL